MALLKNPHPGDILLEDFLKPIGMMPEELAEKVDLPEAVVQELIEGKRPVNADIALRLSRYIGTSAELWLGLQQDYDRMELERADRKAYDYIQPREQAAA